MTLTEEVLTDVNRMIVWMRDGDRYRRLEAEVVRYEPPEHGVIAGEPIVFDRVLSDEDQRQVADHLMRRHGIER